MMVMNLPMAPRSNPIPSYTIGWNDRSCRRTGATGSRSIIGGATDGVTFGVGGAQAATDHPPINTTKTTMFRATLIMSSNMRRCAVGTSPPSGATGVSTFLWSRSAQHRGFRGRRRLQGRIRLRRISAAAVPCPVANIHNACLPTNTDATACLPWHHSPSAHFRQDRHAFKRFA